MTSSLPRPRPDVDGAAPRPTELAVEGPFWRPDSPFRTDLAADLGAGTEATPLRVHGVVASDAGIPLEGALLDVWQADPRGAYGPRLRGRLHAGPGGSYAIDTVVPGPYPEAGRMRPAHVHFKVDHAGHAPLTTQLFFAGDPYLIDDPHVRPGLVRPLEPQEGGAGVTCRFDIVLRRMSK